MSQKTVLIIEDSVDLADTLHDMLVLHGYQALITTTGKEGVTLALAQHPDLIMLDIKLPDISGYEVLHTLRQDTWGKTARFSILTASESFDAIVKNSAVPAAHILFKQKSSVAQIIEHIETRLSH